MNTKVTLNHYEVDKQLSMAHHNTHDVVLSLIRLKFSNPEYKDTIEQMISLLKATNEIQHFLIMDNLVSWGNMIGTLAAAARGESE